MSLRDLVSAESRVRVVAAVAVGVGMALALLTRGRQVMYQRGLGHRGNGTAPVSGRPSWSRRAER
jgi:hypothetical protein